MDSAVDDSQLEEHGRNIAVPVMTAPSTGEPREDLVKTATAFLLNPRVQQSSAERKRAFLVKKGLTPVEIEMAMVGALRPALYEPGPAGQAPTGGLAIRSWFDTLSSAAMGIAVISSAAYGLYWIYKMYVEPRLAASARSSSNIERSVAELMSVVQKMAEERCTAEARAAEQTARISQVVAELRQEMTSLKGMLLARNQFPAPPVTTPTIPSWQKSPAMMNGATPKITPTVTTSATPTSQVSNDKTVSDENEQNDNAVPKESSHSSNEDHKENVIENGQLHQRKQQPQDEQLLQDDKEDSLKVKGRRHRRKLEADA